MEPSHAYASRAGVKLAHACDAWQIPITGAVAADLGSHAGGFVDVLLQRGALKVYAVEKGYGVLDWRLRNDQRVVVMERTDALQVVLPEPVDIVTIDAGWTVQQRIVPVALGLLKQGGHIVSLLKPHYEAAAHARGRSHGEMSLQECEAERDRVIAALAADGIIVRDMIAAPITGAKGGNQEYLIHIVK